MKTAVSIPDDVYRSAERFAKKTKRTRSELYACALREYLKRYSREELRRQFAESAVVLDKEFTSADDRRSARQLRSVQW